jgi:ubiquinone/menaquinone biosynthesis C-methylase UbiE
MEITVESYNETAEQYAKKVEDLHPKEKAERFLAQVPPGGLILDIGCGPGRDAKIFAEQGYQTIGIDPAKRMLELARGTLPGAIFEEGRAERLEFLDGIFDGVWASASLLHLPKRDLPGALAEIRRVIKVGSPVYLSLINGEHEGLRDSHTYGNQKFWSFYGQEEVEKHLKEANFRNIWKATHTLNDLYHQNPWMFFICKK